MPHTPSLCTLHLHLNTYTWVLNEYVQVLNAYVRVLNTYLRVTGVDPITIRQSFDTELVTAAL